MLPLGSRDRLRPETPEDTRATAENRTGVRSNPDERY